MTVKNLKTEVVAMLEKAEQRLMTTWFPDVIDLMMRDECSVRYKSDQLKNFYNCVSVLLSNQIKEFLRNGIAKWTNLFLPENSDFLPLFKVDLVLDDEGMQFLPRYEQLENSLVSVIDEVASRMQNVQVGFDFLCQFETYPEFF